MLVETAVILPFLFVMIFGIMEVGSVLKSYSGASNGVRAGGRMASVAGNDVDADRAILERMATESAGVADEIEYIVIWHATSTGEMPPAVCRPAPQPLPNTQSVGQAGAAGAACNIYHRPAADGGAFDMARGRATEDPEFYFGCTDSAQATTKVDCFWKARDRKTTVTPRNQTPPAGQSATPDYLGVYIRAEHKYITGIIGVDAHDHRRQREPPRATGILGDLMKRFARRGQPSAGPS